MGIHPGKSFWGTFHRLEGLIAFIHYGLFFVVLTGVFKQAKEWISFFRLILWGSVPVGIVGILEYLFVTDFLPDGVDWARLSGTLGNPNIYGSYLVFLIFIGILLIFWEKRGVAKIAVGAITAFNGALLLLSGTRGAWLALVLGATALFFLWALLLRKHAQNVPLRAILIGVAVLLSVFFAAVLAWQHQILPSNIFWERYQFAWKEVDAFENQRFAFWPVAIEAWKQSPLFGYGLESFIRLYDTYYEPSFTKAIPQTSFFDRAHNAFLEFLTAAGLLGLASYIAIFASAFATLWKRFQKRHSLTSLILLSFLAAYFTQAMFIFDITATYLLLFFMLGFIHISSAESESRKPVAQPPIFLSSFGRSILFAVVLSVAALIAVSANQGIALAHMQLAKGKHLLDSVKPAEAFEQFSLACDQEPASIQLGACSQSIRQFITDPFQRFYSSEVKKERETYLKQTAEKFEKDLANHKEMEQVLYYTELANAYRNLYLHTKNPEYLTREERVLLRAMQINPNFSQLFNLLEEIQMFRSKK